MDRAVAKTSDKPAVTKVQQRVVLPTGMIITDSPGLTWPKIDDEQAGLRLAFGGVTRISMLAISGAGEGPPDVTAALVGVTGAATVVTVCGSDDVGE